jgi:hypothetical protein
MIAFDVANSLIGLSSIFSLRTIHIDPAKLPFHAKPSERLIRLHDLHFDLLG